MEITLQNKSVLLVADPEELAGGKIVSKNGLDTGKVSKVAEGVTAVVKNDLVLYRAKGRNPHPSAVIEGNDKRFVIIDESEILMVIAL